MSYPTDLRHMCNS